ncbi:SHS2 domain-containing protein [Clostridium beijerinckii]|uniref:hypothetical protein n=1 Tax=Clostridium beijerinckii TaxID=1520 RepID=UPI0014945765|nr:hypothetical protein [Clostridium beijerinckii]NOW92350.1 SHS2 domain-containing protein [Clostridium beijerinckii]
MKNKKLRIISIIFITLFILLLLPLIINNYIIPRPTYDGWASFLGSYLGGAFGGIGALVAVYITVKQTRDIQERLIKIEEKNNLVKNRTFIQDIMLQSDIKLSAYKEKFKNAKLILTKEFQYIEKIINKESEYFELQTDICNNKNSRFINISQFQSNINDYEKFNKYLFRIISNIGNNPMYDIKIYIEGEWFDAYNKKICVGSYEASIDYIREGETIILPLFKLDERLFLWQLSAKKIIVKYYTGLVENRELITFEINYDIENENIERSIKINEIGLESENLNSKFLKYRYLE